MARRWNPSEGDLLVSQELTMEVVEVDWENRMVEFKRVRRGLMRTSISSARRKLSRGNYTLRRNDDLHV